jgi:hypothetical protein
MIISEPQILLGLYAVSGHCFLLFRAQTIEKAQEWAILDYLSTFGETRGEHKDALRMT